MTSLPTARGPLARPTKAFLGFLREHPALRMAIRAAHNQTVAYAGNFPDGASWERLLRLQLSDPVDGNFKMLPDVLRQIPCPKDLYKAIGLVTPPNVKTILDYVQFLTGDGPYPAQVPWQDDGFIIWRALSGILMSNASGRVRILVGNVPDPSQKVFFKTEIFVLERNPNIDMFSAAAVQQVRRELKAGMRPGIIELI